MGSVVHLCTACGQRLDAAEPAVMLTLIFEHRDGSIDSTSHRRERVYTHQGHENDDKLRGWQESKRGLLRDLIAQ